MPSWDAFCAKYPTEELQRKIFEDLSRALFCKRFDKKYGVFQYSNNPGIETEPILYEDQMVGFQAKYFNNYINSKEIISSIEKAHKQYPALSRIIIYTNKSFGNPKGKDDKTKAQRNVEEYAASRNILVEWQTGNMILDQAAQEEWIFDVFFGSESNLYTLIKEEQTNTDAILSPIKTEISFAGRNYKVNRDPEINYLLKEIGPQKHFIIHGEGGSGKTAIIKAIAEKTKGEMPICIRKAEFFKGLPVAKAFNQTNAHSVDEFIAAYKSENKKVFVIDSAERLQEIDDNSTIKYVIDVLNNNNWSIIFTVRNLYFRDLRDDMLITYKLQFEPINIDLISEQELNNISLTLKFKLPLQESFKDRLKNLFYLNLYVNCNGQEQAAESFKKFIEKVWNLKVCGSLKNRGLSIKRENCFLKIVEQRISSSLPDVDQRDLDAEALQSLIYEEIITNNKYRITFAHDIYEELGLSRYFDILWNKYSSVSQFFSSLGTKYLVRRTFRQWLSDKIDEDLSSVSLLINAVNDEEILPIWRDEVIVAILNSNYSEKYFNENEEALLSNDAKLLNRIVFLLQLACKQFDKFIKIDNYDYPVYKPAGLGWVTVIKFLYHHIENNLKIKYQTNVLQDWTLHNRSGETTRFCGLIALSILAKTEEEGIPFYDKTFSDSLSLIVCNAANEIKPEINHLVDKIITNNWISHQSPYFQLSEFILTKPENSMNLIFKAPDSVINLAKAFWVDKSIRKAGNMYYGLDIERLQQFGIRSVCTHVFSCPSSLQTPLFYLLYSSPQKALDFFIDFTNHCVSRYWDSSKKSGMEDIKEVTLHLQNDRKINVISSLPLWCSYRMSVHEVIPYIFQSMHMAVEKFLLDLSNDGKDKIVESVFDILLNKSKSVSTVAIVASVICAHPDRYWKHAMTLFKTPELISLDNQRGLDERLLGTIYNIGYFINNKHVEERNATLKQEFRKRTLESLCIEYQYVHYSNISDDDSKLLSNEISKILDDHFAYASTLNGQEKNELEILLYRMDRRKHNPKVIERSETTTKIELNPDLPDNVKNFSEEAMSKISKEQRFLPLANWALKKAESYPNPIMDSDFDIEPEKVISEIKELVKAIILKEPLMPMDNYLPFLAAAELIIYHGENISRMDLCYCKTLIERKITSSLTDNYYPQMRDGLESCIHSIPILLKFFPNEMINYENFVLKSLLDDRNIGSYKKVCEYAIDMIRSGELWKINRDFMETVLYDYVLCSLKIETFIQSEISKHKAYNTSYVSPQYSREKVLKYIDKIVNKRSRNQNALLKLEIEKEPFNRIETLLCILENPSKDNVSISIVKRIAPKIASTLQEDKDFDRNSFNVMNIYRSLADYVLNCPLNDIQEILDPFIENMNGDSNSRDFIEAFIIAQNVKPRVDAFWTVWKVLYPTVSGSRFMLSNGYISSYLLADPYLCVFRSWKSLRKSDLWLFSRISKEFAEYPSILYSISRALNHSASEYVAEGIGWIYNIVSQYPDLRLGEDEQATIFNLERIMNEYIRENRREIKNGRLHKDWLMSILTFMVKRNSTQAYMLRELIA